jgi:hypothetical protein
VKDEEIINKYKYKKDKTTVTLCEYGSSHDVFVYVDGELAGFCQSTVGL